MEPSLHADRSADTIEETVHHLERGCHPDRSLRRLLTQRGSHSLTFSSRRLRTIDPHFIHQSQQLGPSGQRRHCALGDSRKIDFESKLIATRTEKAGMSQKSIEALV